MLGSHIAARIAFGLVLAPAMAACNKPSHETKGSEARDPAQILQIRPEVEVRGERPVAFFSPLSPATPVVGASDVANAHSPIVGFDVGHYRACGVREDGRVLCWGDGVEPPPDPSTVTFPHFVPGIVDAVQIAGDDGLFCVRQKAGGVVCFNDAMKIKPTGLTDVVEISKCCARHADGHVTTWITADDKPNAIGRLHYARALGGGSEPECAIDSKGVASCWGVNNFHQLADGTTQWRESPAEIAGLSNVDEIGTSSSFDECARSGTDLKCWGGEGSSVTAPRAFPIHDATHLAMGEYHACVLRKGGKVSCWGSNTSGQLGVPSAKTPSSEKPIDAEGLMDVVELEVGGGEPARGAGTTCVRTREGAILCWGALVQSETPVELALTSRSPQNQ